MEKLCVVIPCYNEEEILLTTANEFKEYMTKLMQNQLIAKESKVLFVNDGSKDKTWDIIQEIVNENTLFSGLNLAANVGHQNAVLAGMFEAKEEFDLIITIDADLQDDINAIEKMVMEYKNGNDIVYGVRSSRKKDTFFKRETAQLFYRIMGWLGVDIVYNHADFRLMSKRSVESLSKYNERNMFLRGIVPLIGYQTTEVRYKRKERLAGESKYPLKKMISFAFDGITSLSIKPITFILILGVFIMLLAFVAFLYVILSYNSGNASDGWSSVMISIWFLGGLQVFSIGVIGLYLGKVYLEVKQRPRYEVQEKIEGEKNND